MPEKDTRSDESCPRQVGLGKASGPRGLERKLWQLGRGCLGLGDLGKLSWDESYSLGRGGRKLS